MSSCHSTCPGGSIEFVFPLPNGTVDANGNAYLICCSCPPEQPEE